MNVDVSMYIYLFTLTYFPFRFIKDDYLQQNSFTKYDKYCPFYKSVEMMRNIVTFHRLATAAVEKTAQGNAEGQKITFNVIKHRLSDVLYKLTSQKFEDPGNLTFMFVSLSL
jgi:V-type H+-transporting ATPase subunit A